MRKSIFHKFISVILTALILNSVIFYIVTSSVILRNSREDMLYTLEAIDSVLDYERDLGRETAYLESVMESKKSRFTIIRRDGSVAADTGVLDVAAMDNHLERQEVVDALRFGKGDSRRYSSTLRENMLYVAYRSPESGYILRLAVPYTGMKEYLIMLFPAICLSFLVTLLLSAFSADKFSQSVTQPLKEISQEMLKVNGDYTELSFPEYQYPEINIIAETTTRMSQNVKEYLQRIELERQIRQEFFSNASHELKTPITSVQGYAELLESGIVPDEERRLEFIRRIKKEAVNMTNLIDDILMIARLESREAEAAVGEIEVESLLDDILESLKPLAAEREVLIHVECEPVRLQANDRQMRELFVNLISNAIKYNKAGGEVWVRVREESGQMLLQVKDSGVGIPAESLPRIFERFYRVDKGRSRKQGGTGLGLSIVKHIVNYYQGTISVESEVDVGTDFTVAIPISLKV